ncbi:beta-galactosidase trimerization domain-containing protein [Micromonospora sp. NPDC127501]|uniref:beta-galactosidase trimerization domain-containing protein n=1 Tax=Micromonospora sp. NPDC127501 TaxID=3154872 RepID=UPI00332E2C16
MELSDGPSRLVRYQQVVLAYHRALWDAGVDLDVVAVTADLSRYDVVVAPALHLLKGDLPQRLEAVATRGGSVLTTYLSGRVDENDQAFLMDVPGPLGQLMGVRVDEWDARGPEVVNPVRLGDGVDQIDVDARLLFELVIPQGAQVVGTYQADFYAGTPAVTRNSFGAGDGWYVAAGLDQAGVSWVVRQVLARHDLLGPYPDVPDLESAVRVAADGSRLLFLLNHRAEPVEVTARTGGVDLLTGDRTAPGGALRLPAYGVVVLEEDR